MSDGHKNFPDAFKALVAIEALKGKQSFQNLAERYDVTTSDISEWCEILQRNAGIAFKITDDLDSELTIPLSSRLSSNDLAQTIAENSTQGFAMMDAKGFCIYANRAWLDMTGYSAEEIHSQPLHNLVHHHYPDGRPFPMHECPIDRALPENFSVRAHQDVFFRKDGSTFEVMCAASPIFEADKPVATVIEIRDITAQNALELALREETQTLEILNESAASIASTLDLNNIIQLVIDASTKLTGAEFGAFFTTSVYNSDDKSLSLTLSGDLAETFENINSANLTALINPVVYGESSIRVDDILEDSRYSRYSSDQGMPSHLEVRSLLSVPVVFYDDGVFAGLLFGHRKPGVFKERHERVVIGIAAQAAIALDNARLYKTAKQAAEEKAKLLESERAARHVAEQQNQAKDTFLAMLGHELRNPLHAISTSLELIELKKSNGIFPTKSFEIIQRQSAHLNRMVEDLLDASRMLTGKLTLNKVTTRFDLALMASIEALQASGKASNHEIKLDIVPATIVADTTRIDQIITNLLNNSLKYSAMNSSIFVKLHVSDGQAILEIRDQGVGITADLQSKIFEPFVQGPRTLGRAEGGLGMGLTIVKTLVTLHQGSIEVFSEGLNKGSTFIVKLPIALTKVVLVKEESPQLVINRRIVIIEDNEDALEMLKSYFEAMDCEVFGANNGKLGLEVIKKQNPDLAIIDIGLPDIDGYEVARRLRSAPETNQLKLIALTGYGSVGDVMEALAAGFDAHLTKPVNMQLLLQHVLKYV